FEDTNASKLAGVAVEAVASASGQSFRENILFTHRGLSGPAILQISNYWTPDEAVLIDLLPDRDIAEIIHRNRSGHKTLNGLLSERASISQAGWAGTIFNGRGPQATPPAKPFKIKAGETSPTPSPPFFAAYTGRIRPAKL